MSCESEVKGCPSSCGGGKGGKRGRLVIIGGGSAAFAAATTAAPEMESVVIVNSGLPMGGCCVNVGCANITSPHYTSPPFHGMSNIASRVTDFKALTAQNESLVEALRQEKYANVITGLDNVQYIHGHGEITKLNNALTVIISSKEGHEPQALPADRIILATGVTTSIPQSLSNDLLKINYLTNENAYFLEKQPESMIVLGGGYVALEAAQMFARLGTRVTIVQRSGRILSDLGEDVSEVLTECLREEGVEIIVGFDATSVTQDWKSQIVLKGTINGVEQIISASKIFLATGRKANSTTPSTLQLSTAKTQHGGFLVSKTLQTSVPGIYAAGDCISGSPQYVYTAAAEGKLAAQNAIASLDAPLDTPQGKEKEIDYSVVPWVIFTSPAIAGIGHSFTTALAQNIPAQESILPLSLLPRAIVQHQTKGFLKLVRNKSTDVIIGARVVAEEGGELIMEAAMAVRFGVKAREMADMFHPYLTWGEGWKLAALGFGRDLKGLSCCAT